MWAFGVDIAPPRLAELEGLLAVDEIARADRFRFARDRARFVAARGTMRRVLGRYVGRAPESLQFAYSAFGKPSLSPSIAHESLRFNASGSDALAVLAVRLDADVGIDAERIRSIPDSLLLAGRMLSVEARHELALLPEDLRERRFLEHWVRKEALVKLLGLGIGGVQDIVEDDYCVISIAAPSEDFVAALATAKPAEAVSCWTWARIPT